jgi:hypothetical protein
MKFEYKKEANIQVGQRLYGIIEVSSHTYDGVYPIYVDEIDYNNEIVIFKINQPCRYVSCSFMEMNDFVFESEVDAKSNMNSLDFGVGLCAYYD